ncbi:MAG: hypothetical protein OTI35_17745, partial [Sulfitobacter sp.]|nr:hypothetical protein [Sulfitobacter sp.]
MSEDGDLYHGGFAGLLRAQERRQRRFDSVADVLPPADVDLRPMFDRILPSPPMPFKDAERFSAQRKALEL